MVITAAAETTLKVQGGLRDMDPVRDLGSIANLVASAFADEIDEQGRAALREMRWMARLSPLVWWWAQADPSFRDSFRGFVWEEPAATGWGCQIVGNVSLNRAPGNRQWWIICNVAVQDEYQGQGIGRRLMEAATAEAQHLAAKGIVLQVFQNNARARKLYTDLGFEQVSGATDLWLETVPSVAVLDLPGYELRAWKSADGQAAYDLAQHVIPPTQQWLRPLRARDYQPDWLSRLVQWMSDRLAGQRAYRLTALKGDRLVATMAVTVAFRHGEHRLALLVHPRHVGQVEATLVSRALHLLAAVPSRPVTITVEIDHDAAVKVLRDYGFKEQRTLLTLRKNLE
jgi:ribosomal protein S18 acetylase RimI-like enzyme